VIVNILLINTGETEIALLPFSSMFPKLSISSFLYCLS